MQTARRSVPECETRHARDKMRKKGDVGIEKEGEKEEGEKSASLFIARYTNFFAPVVPVVPANVFDPVALPALFFFFFWNSIFAYSVSPQCPVHRHK